MFKSKIESNNVSAFLNLIDMYTNLIYTYSEEGILLYEIVNGGEAKLLQHIEVYINTIEIEETTILPFSNN
jgi:hypothetical protein